MKKISTYVAFVLLGWCSSIGLVHAQGTSISGKVINESNNETLAGVNIVVKGKVVGTISSATGDFKLSVDQAPPLTLVFSFIGFETQELEITNSATTGLEIAMTEQSLLGQEVVVSASRVEENILESPVSIEKMDIRAIREAAAPNFYDQIKSLKGIDVSTQSLTFNSINIRGFGANGNTRSVQLIDGIDNQAPGLNFPVGNIVGISDVDLESVEILPGAASALYGPNAIQGIVLMNSKSPFDYQGLTVQAQLGVNHVDEEDDDMSLYNSYQLRYAKAFNNKFAFKVTASWLNAQDWRSVDYRDQSGIVERSVEFDPTVDGYRDNVTTYNGVSVYGDNVLNIGALGQGSSAEALLPTDARGNFSVRGFTESELVDNETESLKLGGALHYRINDEIEALVQYNIGFGSTVYTANDRFVLDDFSIWTGKAEVRGSNFFVRAYTTREDAGDSYAANTLATLLNIQTSIPAYIQGFAGARLLGASIDQAHATAFQASEAARLEVGSAEYNEAFDQLRNTPISQGGAQFLDETSLNHFEGMYNFSNQIDWAEIVVGANFRQYNLKSGGTLFALENIDRGDEFSITEWGSYAQITKKLLDDRLDLTGSIRYDKNENFEGQFSPRISGVFTAAGRHNFRASFQRGFRIPTTQDQFINLDVTTRRLVGSNSALVDQFNFRTNTVYTTESVNAARASGNVNDLVIWDDFDFETEKVNTYEVGYKGLINDRVLVDAYYYFSRYNDFITEVDFSHARRFADPDFEPSPGQTPLYDGAPATPQEITDASVPLQRYGFDVNSDEQIDVQGFAIGVEYALPKGYSLGGNFSYNKLLDEDKLEEQGLEVQFNTPETRFNLSFSNRKVTDKLGFNVTYRWQDAFLWSSAIGTGVIPAFGTLDAQVSYKIPDLKSIVKLGGSNVLNERYTTSFANPRIGALYYISITFDEFLN
ncbi:TonB-dependent receptor [Fulvivirga sp. M361]|uniref:TonB-dependent receptor n=1 Tax=Fulvivirga sp. M361 TaxID=2594266 RepID=UPI00117A59E4|nr:TonB-dependent receptor [Fulvivirga sp. M361]TRX49465.1 TonB-dependent receptor [Fulvivirga sp. M361]